MSRWFNWAVMVAVIAALTLAPTTRGTRADVPPSHLTAQQMAQKLLDCLRQRRVLLEHVQHEPGLPLHLLLALFVHPMQLLPMLSVRDAHRLVAVRLPGTATARELRFFCPVCNATVSQGFPFQACECGGGAMSITVHRAAVGAVGTEPHRHGDVALAVGQDRLRLGVQRAVGEQRRFGQVGDDRIGAAVDPAEAVVVVVVPGRVGVQ